MSEKPKQIKDPIGFLRSSGLLFEINRKVLHPYGLAMAVYPTDDGETEVGTISLMDSREDKEGYLFNESTYISGVTKLSEFLEGFGNEKLAERQDELGYVFQETPDPHIKKNGVNLISYNPAYTGDDETQDDLVAFRVPFEWLKRTVMDWFEMSVPDFLEFYTYDNVEPLYNAAKREGVIMEETTLKDTI